MYIGKTCFVPQWNQDDMEMVCISSWEQYVNLPLNKWNIPEPPHDGHFEKGKWTRPCDLSEYQLRLPPYLQLLSWILL